MLECFCGAGRTLELGLLGARYPVTSDSQAAVICGRPQPVCLQAHCTGAMFVRKPRDGADPPLLLPPPWVLEASLFPGEWCDSLFPTSARQIGFLS